MKHSIRILSMTMALVLSTTPFCVASATNESSHISQNAQSYDSFIAEAIPKHFSGQKIKNYGMVEYSNPITLYDFDTDDDSSSDVNHEVVISGITLDYSSTRFTIVNPNRTTIHDMYISHSSPTTVVSEITYGKYDTWETTRY